MKPVIQNRTYWEVALTISIATYPFTSIASLAHNATMEIVTSVIEYTSLAAMVIFSIFRKRLPAPPMAISNTISFMLFPYAIAVTTTASSIVGIEAYFGYYVALGWALTVLILNIVYERKHPDSPAST